MNSDTQKMNAADLIERMMGESNHGFKFWLNDCNHLSKMTSHFNSALENCQTEALVVYIISLAKCDFNFKKLF